MWPQLRAGLVALAIALGLVDGLPLPPRDDTPAWEQSFVEGLRHARDTLTSPVAWLRPHLRIAQRWAVYQAPGTERWRLWIEARARTGRWIVLYRAGDPAHQEYADILETGRVGGAWQIPEQEPPQFTAFADWLTARVLADHPEVTGVRMEMEKVRLTPDGVEDLGRFAHVHARDRGGP